MAAHTPTSANTTMTAHNFRFRMRTSARNFGYNQLDWSGAKKFQPKALKLFGPGLV
jgi:hypothetical protein